MNRETVTGICDVAGLLKLSKELARHFLGEGSFEAIGENVDNCLEALAIECDCSPADLIDGRVDKVLENMETRKP